MAIHKFFNNFTAGEWSPKLDGRADLQKYDAACLTLENMRVMPHGGAKFRPGTEFLFNEDVYRLTPFEYSTGTRYVIAWTWKSIRIYSVSDYTAGILLMDVISGLPYFVDDIEAMQFRQINDIIYLVTPNHPPAKISRWADDDWRWEEINWSYPPFRDENTSETTLRISPRDGSTCYLHSSAPIFSPGSISPPITSAHNGSYWLLRYPRQASNITLDLKGVNAQTDDTAILNADNTWKKVIRPDWNGVIKVVAHQDPYVGENYDIGVRYFVPIGSGTTWSDNNNVSVKISGKSNTNTGEWLSQSMPVIGNWSISTNGFWWGELFVERSTDGGTTWEVIRKYESKSDKNASGGGILVESALLRMRYVPFGSPFSSQVWTGSPPTSYAIANAVLSVEDAYDSVIVKINSVTSSTQAVVLNTDIKSILGLSDIFDLSPTKIWSEGAWSRYRGFPRTIGVYEQRVFYGGSRNQPNTVWASASGDFENFKFTSNDDSAFAFTFAAAEQNAIQWLESIRRLHASTTGREFIVETGNDEPITPSNISVRTQSANGSEHMQPVVVDDSILYSQRQGRILAEMAYSLERDGYSSRDLTLLADHILGKGIVSVAFARTPDPTVYCVTKDGYLAVLAYDKQQGIYAWSRWKTDGLFKDVISIKGDKDQVWFIVMRGDPGSDLKHIERLVFESDDKAQGCWLDGARIIDMLGSTNVQSVYAGEQFSMGQLVDVVVDGRVFKNMTVGSGGNVTFDPPLEKADYIRIGRPYTGTLQPMKLDITLASGPSQGRKRRISAITPRFYKTVGCKYGPDLDHLDEIPFRNTADNMDASPTEFTGDIPNIWNGGNDGNGYIVLVHDDPLPFTLIGLSVKWEVFGE